MLKTERETGVSRHALRPDLYPDESDTAPNHDRRRRPDSAIDRLLAADR